MAVRLLAIKKLKITITLKTGLHIGSSKENIAIGDIDNSVVKLIDLHPDLPGAPYIPGSSLKGKLRSLLELKKGVISPGGSVHTFSKEHCLQDGKLKCEICKFFGTAPTKIDGENLKDTFISRLVFEDLYLSKEWQKIYHEIRQNPWLDFTEIKAENTINRQTGKAANPRLTERVPAGVSFEGFVLVKVFNTDTEEGKVDEYVEREVKQKLFEQNLIPLLENDYLGGNGTRGYGRVTMKVEIEDD